MLHARFLVGEIFNAGLGCGSGRRVRGSKSVAVLAGGYWRLEKLESFDEFLDKRFPDSRRKAFYLMTIHEHLTLVPKHTLKPIGWIKAREWAIVEGGIQREVERYLTGRKTAPHEIPYFKVYGSQPACKLRERSKRRSALMPGSDKPRGNCRVSGWAQHRASALSCRCQTAHQLLLLL